MQALREKKRHWEKLRPAKKAERLENHLVDQQRNRLASIGNANEVMEAARAIGILNNNLLSHRHNRLQAARLAGRWLFVILKGLLRLAFVGPRLVRHQAPGVWQERHEFEYRNSGYERL